MQNNTVSRESMDAEIAELRALIEEYEKVDGANTISLRQKLRKLETQQHPDDWFIDPGSGMQTEDGRRRRRAMQACWADCPMKARLLCLDQGMQEGPTLQYGVYGGYTERQRQTIIEDIKKRKERASEPTDE